MRKQMHKISQDKNSKNKSNGKGRNKKKRYKECFLWLTLWSKLKQRISEFEDISFLN